MTTVVDASVAIKWFVQEPGHNEALLLLDRQDEIFAPDCIIPDMVEAVWARVRQAHIGDTQGSAIIAAITSGVPTLLPVVDFAEEAMRKAGGMPKTGRLAFYLCCAEALQADFISADEATAEAARKFFDPDRVRHLPGRLS